MIQKKISLTVPPFPIFIEGNYTKYPSAFFHPNRKNLPYFDILIIKKGTLYLQEEDIKITAKANDMVILLPQRHHFAPQPTDTMTEFYWLHFYTDGNYTQSDTFNEIVSDIPIPLLHFHNQSHTLHFEKVTHLLDHHDIYSKIESLLQDTTLISTVNFWDIQQKFFSLLTLLESQGTAKDNNRLLADKIITYLREHYAERITMDFLSRHFNLHQNTITNYLKKYYKTTAIDYLNNFRLEQARVLLIKTDYSIEVISELCGVNLGPYFSKIFKKKFNFSPLQYRKKHLDTQ